MVCIRCLAAKKLFQSNLTMKGRIGCENFVIARLLQKNIIAFRPKIVNSTKRFSNCRRL